ncbi:MAG: tellurite-like stress resistance cysteine protease StiP, partial [Gordonia sp. (in: high G+C Gram-positive bacteria)]
MPLRGPAFGSYRADEVTWLLKDLSHVALEGDLAERERRIQSGAAHYAESLPIEYQPGPAYQELFRTSLAASARRLAEAVAAVAELVVAERDRTPTLVSLARAGTPVGILMRRWIAFAHGVDVPHYTMSIVRDRGIDTVALDHVTAAHRPSSIVFVDGWTGKGAIQKELTAALADYASVTGTSLNSELAVLADPGRCTRTFGTRDDFLISSACLNSTVSGLVSRTVLNADHIG